MARASIDPHPAPVPGRGHRARRAGSALVAALLLTIAWAQVEAVDDLGTVVRLERPPTRVVSMVPSHTETVCALGRCDVLVGRDTFSNHPPDVLALPDLGSPFTPDLEALVALEPDLVLVDEYSGLGDAVAALGIPVYAGTPQRLEGVFDHIERLGVLLDARSEATELTGRIRGEIDRVATLAAAPGGPSVYFEIDASPYSVGPESFIGTLIELAGGRNVVTADLGEFPLLDPEFVVAADPEVIVLANAPYGESAATLADRPGWGGIRAVRDGRVAELTAEQADVLSRAGPRVGEAVLLLARIFHPGRF